MGVKRPIKVKLGGEKYCPIDNHPESTGMCQKEKCAWWVDTKTRQQCAIAEITILLDWIRRGYDK